MDSDYNHLHSGNFSLSDAGGTLGSQSQCLTNFSHAAGWMANPATGMVDDSIERRMYMDYYGNDPRSSSSSPSLEPWYEGLETDQDWDEFRDVARTVLAAVEADDNNETTENDRDRKRSHIDNNTNEQTIVEDDDIRLARLIQEEEAVLWRNTQNRTEQQEQRASTTRTKLSTTTTIVLDPQRKRVWKLASDVVFVVATAAVAAIGYQVVRQRKR